MNKLLYIFICVCFISCSLENEPITPPHEPTPDNRTQEEINAAVLEVLKEYAPHIVNMDKGIAQVKELMNTLHNVARLKNSPILVSPDLLLYNFFTDEDFGVQCGGFSRVTFDSLTALGYDARIMQFFMEIPDGHNANEVKIDEKIYALDTAHNIMFKDDEGEYLSFKEVKDRLKNGKSLIVEYVGNTQLHLDNYYMPYEQYFMYIVRALPFGKGWQVMVELDIPVYGAEIYYWNND